MVDVCSEMIFPARDELSSERGTKECAEVTDSAYPPMAPSNPRTKESSEDTESAAYPSKFSPQVPVGPQSAKAKEIGNWRRKFRSHSEPFIEVECDPYGVLEQEGKGASRQKKSPNPVVKLPCADADPGDPYGILEEEAICPKLPSQRRKLNPSGGKYATGPAATAETKACSGTEKTQEKERIELEKMQLDRSELVMGDLIGSGTAAEVFQGTWRGNMVAIKQFVSQPSSKRKTQLKQEISLLRETEVIAQISHDNLVKFYGLAFEQQPFLLISEFCTGGTVFDVLYENDEIELVIEQQLKMCCDVAWAMSYLHDFKPQIIHRDLKSLNLLLFEPVTSTEDVPHVKVSDFGFCKMRDEASDWGKMTRGLVGCWMAPEAAMGTYTEKADVYSFAMVLFELICQELPFADVDEGEVLQLASKGERPDMEAVPPNMPANLVDLMESCWAPKPGDRPSFDFICRTLSEIVAEVLD